MILHNIQHFSINIFRTSQIHNLLDKYVHLNQHLKFNHILFNNSRTVHHCLLPSSEKVVQSLSVDKKRITALTGTKSCRQISKLLFTDSKPLCYNEWKKLRRSKEVRVIDVREHSETLRTGTVPGSLCIPLKELESALNMPADQFKKIYCAEHPNQNNTLIFICRKGQRSFTAANLAKKMGYDNSYFYQGGFMSWFEQERKNREKEH